MNENETNVGKKWLAEEDNLLLEEIKNKEPYDKIALLHKRTINGIKCRIISKIIYERYKNDNIDINDLSNEYNIEKEMIMKYINKMEIDDKIKKSISQNKTNTKINNKNNSKNKIEEIVLRIEEKLNHIIKIISENKN